MTVTEPRTTWVLPGSGTLASWSAPEAFPAMRPVREVQAERRSLAECLRSDRAFPQLVRFALVGGLSNITYVLLFFILAGIGPLAANVAGSLVSTVLANEMHRRLTFHAAERVGWFTAQWEGGGLALLGLIITTAGLAALGVWAPDLGSTLQAAAVIALTGAVGGLRFLALRGFVF